MPVNQALEALLFHPFYQKAALRSAPLRTVQTVLHIRHLRREVVPLSAPFPSLGLGQKGAGSCFPARPKDQGSQGH